MKINTNELSGTALDWAVARIEGEALVDGCLFTKDPAEEQVLYTPSTDWSQGGPIIEREKISIECHGEEWIAQKLGIDYYAPDSSDEFPYGPTPLTAAMRCYVASKLGDEIEIPEGVER